MTPRFLVKNIRWWHKPIPLMKKNENGFDQVGWVWNQTAYCVKNLHHGWIAFIEDQTKEKIDMFVCDNCGSSMSYTKQSALSKFLRSTDKE